MTARDIAAHVEFASDALQQSIDDVADIVRAAEEEARYEVTRGDVLEHLSMNMMRDDVKIFMRALREERSQDIAMMLDLIQKSFKALVAEKKRAILAKELDPADDSDFR
jgi:hypothetical protein